MNRKLRIAALLAICGFLVYRTTVATASRSEGAPEITAEGVIVHAGLNSQSDSDTQLYGAIEGSVQFMANIEFQKVLDNCMKAEVLARISPNVSNVKAVKSHEDADSLTYDVEEEIAPLPGFASAAPAKVFLKFSVNKRALKDRTLAIKFELDPARTNKWKRLSGRIFAVDLNNGYSSFMVATSSRSHYDALPTMRIKLVKSYLAKTKDQMVSWLASL